MTEKPRNWTDPTKPPKRERVLERNGEILQMNEGQFPFTLADDEESPELVLHLSLSKFLDTSLIDLDVHPTFVRVLVKDKMFQLKLPEPVKAAESHAQRSQATGALVVYMPREVFKPPKTKIPKRDGDKENLPSNDGATVTAPLKSYDEQKNVQALLEQLGIDESEIPPLE